MDIQRIGHIWLSSLLTFVLSCGLTNGIKAQKNSILNDRIATLKVVAGEDWLSMPIVPLNGKNINISFDDLTHEYNRYTYKIEHLDADWNPSADLFPSDYIDGFTEGNTIDPEDESVNTNTLYTHYKLTIPNERCSLKMSGNYRITVYDENNDNDPMFMAYFMVVDQQTDIMLKVSSNTDAGINTSFQQVEAEVNYGNIRVTDPQRQIKTVMLQNGLWEDARVNIKPQMRMGNGLRWMHNKDYIFDGGNEYRKFETLDVTHTTMGLEAVNWDGKEYHAWIWTDEPRPSYVYDESANGNYYIRNSDNDDNDIKTEYVWVHFRLKSPRLPDDVYVNGDWTYGNFDEKYKMRYNEEEKIYELEVKLKQGYYSYQYLTLHSDGTLYHVPSEGNFYQTENMYQMLIYYRGNSDVADRLVGYQQVQYK